MDEISDIDIHIVKFRKSLRTERLTTLPSAWAEIRVVHALGEFQLTLQVEVAPDQQFRQGLESAVRLRVIEFAEQLKQAANRPLLKRKPEPPQSKI